MKRDLLTILDLSRDEIYRLLNLAKELKNRWKAGEKLPDCSRKTLGLLFEKPSTRTRISFQVAIYRLGGQAIYMTPQDTQLSRDETLADTARVLSRYLDALVVRTFGQNVVEELAKHSTIPVINGLTDSYHPCQVLSDLFTLAEKRGNLDDLKVAWVGDGNNVAHSWINAAARLGFKLWISCPEGYWPREEIIENARSLEGKNIFLVPDPREAVSQAEVINTDVWASMGQEAEAQKRREVFRPFQVNQELLKFAPENVYVMHCLPAHRGEEITDEVMDGPNSIVFDQAENRMHFQIALLAWLLT
ncbi:MAG TPA: ornithine carbamoyltransferase [Deltaproteobacteria bacterium]|nr:ornithine carbamoyltransferase [Deltaproteobacteria bacterium]